METGGEGDRGREISAGGRDKTGVDGDDGDRICYIKQYPVVVKEQVYPNLRTGAVGASLVSGRHDL